LKLRIILAKPKPPAKGEMRVRETTDAERDDARLNNEIMRLRKLPENLRKSDDEIAEIARAALFGASSWSQHQRMANDCVTGYAAERGSRIRSYRPYGTTQGHNAVLGYLDPVALAKMVAALTDNGGQR
jgi:hypothetical protein